MEIFNNTALELSKALQEGKISSQELTKAFIDRVKQVDDKIGAFLYLNEDDALDQAKASDLRRASGKALSVFDGVPLGIKDVIAVKNMPLTCASKMLENFISPYDASVITSLKQKGLVIFGRLNLDEFAMGSSCENSAFKITSNPWNLERIPGGSSGGSAASVSAGEVPFSLGSDTGGSIRQPASLCGVVGLKPTYGLVSRFGLAAFASSLDQIGTFTSCVEDAAALLQMIAFHDKRDSTSVKVEVPNYLEEISKEQKEPLKIGIPKEYFGDGISKEVLDNVNNAIALFEKDGAKIVPISLPHTDLAVPVYYVIATAEASSNLARYDGIRYTHRSSSAKDAVDIYYKSRAEGFGEEVKRRIILGTYVLSSGYYDAYYLRAQKIRSLIRDDFVKAFESVDVILTPTSPTVAFKKGEKTTNPMEMYLSDICTISTNLAGLPGISVPCGFDKDNLPIGVQLIGKPFDEVSLLKTAYKFEKISGIKNLRPNLA